MTNAITKAAILGAVIHGLQPLAAPHATAGKATRPAQAAGRARRRAMNSTPARPPRRALRRQARMLPPHVAQQLVLAELERLQASVQQAALRRRTEVDLGAVLAAAWDAFKTSVWCVSDLRQAQIIGDAAGPAVGAALRELVNAGGRWGRLHLAQVSGVETRSGRVWCLRRI